MELKFELGCKSEIGEEQCQPQTLPVWQPVSLPKQKLKFDGHNHHVLAKLS